MSTQDFHDDLSDTGGPCCPDLVIHIKACSKNRRIAHTAMILESRTAGGAGTGKIPVLIDDKHADRIMVMFTYR
jgi:hypothetical protein